MAFLGTVIGVVLGWMLGGFAGALSLGLLGLVIALLFRARAAETRQGRPVTPVQQQTAAVVHEATMDIRLERIEKRLTALESRMNAGYSPQSANVAAEPAASALAIAPSSTLPPLDLQPPPIPVPTTVASRAPVDVMELKLDTLERAAEPEPRPQRQTKADHEIDYSSLAIPAASAAAATGVAPSSAAPQDQSAAADARVPEAAPAIAAAPSQSEIRKPAPESNAAQRSTVTNAGAPPADVGGSMFDAVKDFFTGGNAIVRVGVIILFFGVAFLLKYAFDRMVFPPWMRVAGVGTAGLVSLAVGWGLRDRKAGFGLALQGLGVGLLYLALFGAYRLYGLIDVGPTLALMILVAVLAAVLAIKQDSMAIAALGVTGGFLAPVLAAKPAGNHVTLFTYYAILNFGILVIALYRAWKPLHLLGFAFTFGVGALWGYQFYQPKHFHTTEPFLILFFLFYVAIAVLYAFKRAKAAPEGDAEKFGYIDGTLVFGTPMVAFALQAALVKDFEYGLAWSALALSAFYLVLSALLWPQRKRGLTFLIECFFALSVIFGTLAIPLGLDARWTNAAFAIEGAGLVWVGARQRRLLATSFGILLQLVAGAAYLNAWPWLDRDEVLFNPNFMGTVMLAFAAWFSAWVLHRADQRAGKDDPRMGEAVGWLLMLWGTSWWAWGLGGEVYEHVAPETRNHVLLLAGVATAFVMAFVARRSRWSPGLLPAWCLLPWMGFVALLDWWQQGHFLYGAGYSVWPIAIVAMYVILRQIDKLASTAGQALHVPLAWFVALFAWAEIHYWLGQWQLQHTAWGVVLPMLPFVCWVALIGRRDELLRWPVTVAPTLYRPLVGQLFAIGLVIWLGFANFNDGASPPLPYIPVLNVLDLGILLTVWVLFRAWQAWRRKDAEPLGDVAQNWLYVLGFVFVNATLLRAVHHWAGIPYRLDALLASKMTQAVFALGWTVTALVLMFMAHKKSVRTWWQAGAVLLAVVVAKLLLIDLGASGTVERIVSFMGVGALMLVIGYVAPMPPKSASPQKA